MSSLKRIKASSLTYAIVLILFIGLFTSGILMMSSSYKLIEVKTKINENLLFNTVNNVNRYLFTNEKGTIFNDTSDTSVVTITEWGGFNVIHCKSFYGTCEFEKFALIGEDSHKEHLALYLTDKNQSLKLTGDTKIEGNVYLPKRGVEKAYIGGNNYKGERLIYGNQLLSEKQLPILNEGLNNFDVHSIIGSEETVRIEEIQESMSQKFNEPILYYQSLESIFLRDSIKGKVLIQSFDSIYISNDAFLENVIVSAPIIRIEKGFSGSLQMYASKKVTVEEGVQLTFPTTIQLTETNGFSDEQNGVYMREGSSILGGILLTSKDPNFRKPVELLIESYAFVSGLVYNQGSSDVKGGVIGSLYTNKINLKTRSGEYSNHLLNATISSKQLPDYFLMPDWLENKSSTTNQIVSWL